MHDYIFISERYGWDPIGGQLGVSLLISVASSMFCGDVRLSLVLRSVFFFFLSWQLLFFYTCIFEKGTLIHYFFARKDFSPKCVAASFLNLYHKPAD